MSSFSDKAFARVWAELDDEARQAVLNWAAWEHMSPAAVMADCWPDLWRRVIHPDEEDQ